MTDPNLPSATATAAGEPGPAGDPAGAAATSIPEAPPPTFDVLPLSSELRETLAEIGYVHPTPVQLAVWEPATRGRDAVVQARTGTGKTAAFGLPIVDHLVKRSSPHVQVLALCPTRELALQVSAEIERLGKRKGVKIAAIYGGAPMQRQVDAIAGGAQVVVGTPGRVLDHIRRGTLSTKHVKLLVLDECDEMLSMGFERELSAILAELPAERQTLLFSATVPPDIERIAKTRLRSPEFVTLSGDAVGALSILHFVYLVTGDKIGSFIRIIEVENPESAIVFCNTRDETETVSAALRRQGFDAEWLNGDLPQSDREKVMSATREGRLRFLVATDVAARGIDISHLTHVINYDFPQDAEAYVHRTGRTGRAGRTGTAISLITPQDIGGLYLLRLTYKIRPLERQIPTEGELKTRAEADLVAMLAEAFLSKGSHPDDLALARRLLTHDQADVIVAGLLRDHLGARPTSQDEASAARRAAQPQRAPREGGGRGREGRAPRGRAGGERERAPAAAAEERGERAPAAAKVEEAAGEGAAREVVELRQPDTERSLRERELSRERGERRGHRDDGRRRGEAKPREEVPPSAEPLTRPDRPGARGAAAPAPAAPLGAPGRAASAPGAEAALAAPPGAGRAPEPRPVLSEEAARAAEP
ncbi:MAG: DEAD/DEAH box helicase, partial [Polyangiaceae bacterium]|nr:DEAD/DEAH box helicase [Polyangiaceae bacterium]